LLIKVHGSEKWGMLSFKICELNCRSFIAENKIRNVALDMLASIYNKITSFVFDKVKLCIFVMESSCYFLCRECCDEKPTMNPLPTSFKEADQSWQNEDIFDEVHEQDAEQNEKHKRNFYYAQ
jgi:hypothetical protein